MAEHNELGRWGEGLAAIFLRSKGYCILETDWSSGHRDIDIVAVKWDTIVFVEVKTRSTRKFGDPELAVDYKKGQNIQKSISAYLRGHRLNQPFRFDIIAIVGTVGGQYELKHIVDVKF